MSILTKQEMNNINLAMLGQGAPVDIDGVGYNKVDYGKMAYLSGKTDLTDNEAYVLATVLLKYSNTQLSHMADRIKETIQHYQKLVKEVRVVDFNRKSVKLSWNFNRAVSDYIKYDMDRTHFKWLKPNGEWVLDIQWDYLKQLVDVFQANGFSTTSLQTVWDNLNELLGDEPKEQPDSIILKVERPSTTIDTLVIEVPYHESIVKAFKNIPYMFYIISLPRLGNATLSILWHSTKSLKDSSWQDWTFPN